MPWKIARTVTAVIPDGVRKCSRNVSVYLFADRTFKNHCFICTRVIFCAISFLVFFVKTVSEQNVLWALCFSMVSGSVPRNGMVRCSSRRLPENIEKQLYQRSFCSETFLSKNTKNAIAQNTTLVHIKTMVLGSGVCEHIN